MPLWPLPGGTVADPPSDQNFRSLAEKGGGLEEAFPRLVTAEAVKIHRGTVTLEWAGETFESKGATVSHGLGEEPLGVAFSQISNGEFVIGTPIISTRNTTEFVVAGYVLSQFAKPAAGKTLDLLWIAMG